VIHMLHEMLHDPAAKDSDARFRELLQGILTKYRFRALTAEDFQREVERQMTPAMDLEGTRRMDWFFDEWVRETGIPHYSVKFEVKPHETSFLLPDGWSRTKSTTLFTAPRAAVCSATGNTAGSSRNCNHYGPHHSLPFSFPAFGPRISN